MAFCDFVIRHDPEKESVEDLSKKILISLYINRIKAKKPVITFVSGESGEGKSINTIKLIQVLLELQGLNIKDFLHDINVYTPLQYPTKLDAILYDKRLKKVNMIVMHEAREIVKAKMWHSFLTQAIGDVNAMSRAIKRLMIFIISQFIRDIATDIRYTLNYYIKVARPRNRRARFYIYKMWKDDKDLEKPKLRKRKISGYLLLPNGTSKRYSPQYLELKMPDKEIVDEFDKKDMESKSEIIKRKLNKLIKEMSEDLNLENKKIEGMIKFYSDHPESLKKVGTRSRGKWKVNPEFKDMHDLNKDEVKAFSEGLDLQLKAKGLIK